MADITQSIFAIHKSAACKAQGSCIPQTSISSERPTTLTHHIRRKAQFDRLNGRLDHPNFCPFQSRHCNVPSRRGLCRFLVHTMSGGSGIRSVNDEFSSKSRRCGRRVAALKINQVGAAVWDSNHKKKPRR